MALAKPIIAAPKAGDTSISWNTVKGAFGYTVRETSPQGVTRIEGVAQDKRTYPAKPGYSYTVEARGERSASVKIPAAPAPTPNPQPAPTPPAPTPTQGKPGIPKNLRVVAERVGETDVAVDVAADMPPGGKYQWYFEGNPVAAGTTAPGYTIKGAAGSTHHVRASVGILNGPLDGDWTEALTVVLKGTPAPTPPAPTPTPTPTPSPGGRPTPIGQRLDFDGSIGSYGGTQLGTVTIAHDDPRLGGGYLKLVSGDSPDGLRRAHLHSNLRVKQGDERVWAWSVRVPRHPGGSPGWWSLCSWFGAPWEGVAPMQMQITPDRSAIQIYNGPDGSGGFGPVASVPTAIGQWHDFVMPTRFSTGGDGWFDVHHRLKGGTFQQLGGRYQRQTLPSANGGGSLLLISSYAQSAGGNYETHHDEHALYGSLADAKNNWGGQ